MKKLVAALLLVSATAVWADDVEDGLAAYNKGDYKTAASLFKKGAAQGDVRAQNNLAWMYDQGKGVLQDYAEAVRWYKLSAEQGDPKGQYNLGLMYNRGKGVLQDYLHAHMWMNLKC